MPGRSISGRGQPSFHPWPLDRNVVRRLAFPGCPQHQPPSPTPSSRSTWAVLLPPAGRRQAAGQQPQPIDDGAGEGPGAKLRTASLRDENVSRMQAVLQGSQPGVVHGRRRTDSGGPTSPRRTTAIPTGWRYSSPDVGRGAMHGFSPPGLSLFLQPSVPAKCSTSACVSVRSSRRTKNWLARSAPAWGSSGGRLTGLPAAGSIVTLPHGSRCLIHR